MGLKRTNVYADEEDLAIIEEAAKRLGTSKAEIIREALHLAAMKNRAYEELAQWPMFHGGGKHIGNQDIRDAVAEGATRNWE